MNVGQNKKIQNVQNYQRYRQANGEKTSGIPFVGMNNVNIPMGNMTKQDVTFPPKGITTTRAIAHYGLVGRVEKIITEGASGGIENLYARAGKYIAKGQQAVVVESKLSSEHVIRIIPSINSKAELEADQSKDTPLGKVNLELKAFEQVFGAGSVEFKIFDLNASSPPELTQLGHDIDDRLGSCSSASLMIMQMPKIEGSSLRDIAKKKGALPSDIKARMKIEAQKLFDNGIHVDAGLGNFMLDEASGALTLIDFQGFVPHDPQQKAKLQKDLDLQLSVANREIDKALGS